MPAPPFSRSVLILVALTCFLSESGGARYKDWVWRTSGARPSLRADDRTREQVNHVNSINADFSGIKKGLIDPDQPHWS